jgi:hypothetical protein
VAFSQMSGPGGCTTTTSFAPGSTTTDVAGQAATNATLPTCPGAYVLAATGGGVTITASVTVTGGFADTSALPQAVGAGDASSWGPRVIALGIVLTLVGLLGYRFRSRRTALAEEPAWPTSDPVGTPRKH